MGLRCREGDQAIVLVGPHIGYIVKVGKFLGNTRGITLEGLLFNAVDAWEIHCKDIKPTHGASNSGMEDRNLQPIRGPKTWQTTTTQKEMKA